MIPARPDPGDVQHAWSRISAAVHRTPLLTSRTLSERVGAEVLLKAEHQQKTGSFKVRGALNFLHSLDPVAAAKGVVTISAGNHAQAVAWAAARVGVPAVVVMPDGASRAKVAASVGYGAEVVLHGTVFEAFRRAHELAEERGLTFVHPFDAPPVMAGQGTVALEIMAERPDIRTVIVPIGGGGLMAGIATALSESDVRLVGVEPEGAAAMRRSLDEGRAVRLDRVDTIADGLGAPMAGELTYPIIRDHVSDVVVLSDREIAGALAFLLTYTKQLVEPGGAAGVAAVLDGKLADLEGPLAIVLSGGNLDLERLPELLELAGPDL